MKPNWPLRLVALATVVLAFVVSAWQLVSGSSVAANRVVFAVVVGVYLSISLLIAERRPGNAIALVIFLMGALIALYLGLDVVVSQAGREDIGRIAAWLVSLLDAPMFLLISLLFLLFPSGELPSPRWRWLLIADGVLGVAVTAWTAFKPGPLAYYPQVENPFGRPEGWFELVGPVGYMLLLGSIALSALSLVGRWRRGGQIERAQLKWVALAAAVAAVIMGSYGVFVGPGAFSEFFDLLVGIALGFFPIAIGIAITRYRLFEIDRLVSRTIAYLIVTALLVAGYASVILFLQGPLGGITGGDTLAVALSTLAAAALFQPLRRRVQSVVDRRFDRARFDADRTIEAFAARLRTDHDLLTVREEITRTADSAVRPRSVSVWLRNLEIRG